MVIENRITWFTILHAGILTLIYWVFGTKAVIFQIGYAGVGIFFIELINYTEHYGLKRKKDARGIYEPIGKNHSWNAASSHLLFRIQRHSDHHMHSYRPYQILRKMDDAPQMPYDYLYNMLLGLFPPLWFETMDPLIENRPRESELAVAAFFLFFVISLGYGVHQFL